MNDWLQLGPQVMEGLVVIATKTSLILILALLVVRIWRRLNSATRCVILLYAVIASVVLPTLSYVLPTWQAMPRWQLTVGETVVPKRPPSATGISTAPRESAIANKPEGQPSPLMETSMDPVPSSVNRPFTIINGLVAIYFIGFLGCCLRIYTAQRAVIRINRQAPFSESPVWQEMLNKCCKHLKINQLPTLRIHPKNIMPTTWGGLRPTILLPAAAEQWPIERREAVLLHELAHIKRRDIPVQLVLLFVCAVQWFNPLIWMVYRRLVLERERACDDRVLDAGVRPDKYAQDLLQTAVNFNAMPHFGTCMAQPSEIETRLLAILDKKRNRRRLSVVANTGILIAFFMVIMPLSALGFHPTSQKGEAGPFSVDRDVLQLASDLGSNDTRVRRKAAETVLELGGDHDLIERLSAHLFQILPNNKQHFRDFGTIEFLTGETQLERLLQAIDDDFEINRAAAAQTLQSFNGPMVTEKLIAALDDESAHVREWSVRSLGKMQISEAVPAMVNLLNDPEAEVREWTIRALGMIGDRAALPAFLSGLRDPASEVREWSLRCLGNLGLREAVADIMLLLEDTDPNVREWAVRALGKIGDPSAFEGLSLAMNDEEAEVREWAARSIGSIGGTAAVPALIQGLRDPAANVREWCVRSLGNLGSREALDALTTMLDDEEAEVRRWAIRSIANIAEP